MTENLEVSELAAGAPGGGDVVKALSREVVALRAENRRLRQRERELTFEERATWGDCPVCGAVEGEGCHPEVGFQLGRRADGRAPRQGDGAHLARLAQAPRRVRLVEVP